jgi:hypothetical protein
MLYVGNDVQRSSDGILHCQTGSVREEAETVKKLLSTKDSGRFVDSLFMTHIFKTRLIF